MLTAYAPAASGLRRIPLSPDTALPEEAVWFDLLEPTRDEVARLERALAAKLPSFEEMQEIEASSRLYAEDGAAYMTSTIITHAEAEHPESAAVSFVLLDRALVTLRYADPQPFRLFVNRAGRTAGLCVSADTALIGLLESVIDRLADILEKVGMDLDGLSKDVFRDRRGRTGTAYRDLQDLLRGIGRAGDLISRAQESLLSLQRQILFFRQNAQDRLSAPLKPRVKALAEDLRSLAEHVHTQSSNTAFLLDATLGMINIQQNDIIKIFSVVAVIFLPPTLIASLYGMNFRVMPELSWPWGYPMALVLMVISSLLPYLYFKRKGWL